MPRLTRFLALLAVLAIVQPVAVAQAAAEQVVISDGHVDLGPRFVDGQWTVQLRDDTDDEPRWRALSDVVLHVTDTARATVPDDPAYDFLGDRGSPIWVLPQVEQDGVVWPGWNTQDPEVTAVVDREVTWRLHGARGPGRFVLFLSGNFGAPTTIFSSADPTPQETGIEVGTHVHGNWAFGAPGTYLLDIEMATSTKDRRELSDRRVLRVHVGGADARVAFDVPTSEEVSEPEQSAAPPPPRDLRRLWIGAGALLAVGVVAAVVVRRRR